MSSFGGTVKLTGESEYRKALGEISSNLKVLNSEMKAVTSQYDKNDKSVENLSSQNEVLNKKIDEQEKKVAILKDALAQSAQETGENSEKTKKWQTELNNAQAELNTLNRKVNENADAMKEAEQGTKEEADAVEDFGKEADKSGEKALSLGDIIKANLISDAIKGGLSALVDGFKSLGSAMSGALTDGAAYADTFLTLSAQTGLSTDTLEKYNAVAELADVSVETFTGSLAKTTKAMGEAQKGSTKYVEAYKQLGVSVTDANGNLRDSEDVYWETVDALKGIENETERDALAMELFGKKAQDLNTIIDMGSEGFKELEQTAVDMGAVLGGEGLQALGALDDQMQIFSSTTGATKNILASAFAPAMSGALEGVNALGGAFNGLIAAVISGEGVDQAFYMVSEGLTDLIVGIEEALPQVMTVVGDLFNMLLDLIAEYLPWLIEEGATMLSSLLSGISQNLGEIFPVILSVVETLLNTIMENLPMLIEMGITMLTSLINGIAEMLPELIPMAIDCVITIVETLLDNIDLIIDAAINIVMALADGLLEALPDLIEKIPVIIDKLIVALTNNLPKLIEMGIELTIKLAVGLIKAIPQLLKSIPKIMKSLFDGFTSYYSKIGEIGLNLVKGLWNGIKDATGWILEKIKGFGKSVLNGIKSFFGIHSPSTVFKDEIGKNLALGVGEGFADTMADVSADMQGAIPTEFDADINTNMKMATGNTQLSTYDMMVSAFKQALTEVKVVLDDREMGGFVTDTVERVVFA
jgi:phage-related protein